MNSYSQSRPAQNTPPQPIDGWNTVIASATQGDIEPLHRFFYSSLVVFYARRGYGQDAADLAMNAVMATARSIRRGEIKDAAKLPGYVRIVASRALAATIEGSIKARNRECAVTPNIACLGQTPEQLAIEKEQTKIIRKVLGAISSQEREILTRFYIHGQTKEEICEEMQLTDDQFRNTKSRAKIRVTSMVKSFISRNSSTAARPQSRRAA